MEQQSRVLFCGDAHLKSGAAYLAGVMSHLSISYDYIEMQQKLPDKQLEKGYALIIFSDYPSTNVSDKQMLTLVRLIEAGTSFCMIGGWESFHGLLGFYDRTPLAEALPVRCKTSDDRNNVYQGFIAEVSKDHEIVRELPFHEPPVMCGYNSFAGKDGSEEILRLKRIVIKDGVISLDEKSEPLLVLGRYGQGKTCAIATDFAPHWVGGLVDWGDQRVQSQAPGANAIEVGNYYVQFIGNILRHLIG